MKPVYVFGHKNPDTDSVMSAIALSYLKNQMGMHTVPRVIGPVNRETKFALDYFKVKTPSYLNDVRVRISDIKYVKKAFISETATIDEAFNFMRSKDLTAIPLVDKKKHVTGYITLKDIAKYMMQEHRIEVDTNLKYLLKTLKAKIVTNFDNNFQGKVAMITFSTEAFINEVKLAPDSILIVGDRYKVIERAIDEKIKLIILTRDRVVPVDLLKKAIKNRVNIITSAYTSFDLCTKLTTANFVKMINKTPNPLTVNVNEYLEDFKLLTQKYNYTNYPVINDAGECQGVIRLNDVSNYTQNQVILVDHNNYEQSVEGLEEAEILEVFDHHNIGNIGTTSPIYFSCRPVGCTATIICDRYKKEGIKIPKDMAGIMLSAIISDTLLFTSPTTTEIDKEYATMLSKIACVDIEKYGMSMLVAASSIQGLTPVEVIGQDFKSYSISDNTYGIAVVTTMEFDKIEEQMDEYIKELNLMCETRFKGVLLFAVDIIKQGSFVIYSDSTKNLVETAFNLGNVCEGTFLPGIVSRKKQILPPIMKVLEK